MTTVLSPEARRLLATVRRVVEDRRTDVERHEVAGVELDGGKLLALALQERAVSVVWNDLDPGERSALVPEVAESFRGLASVEEFRARVLASRLEDVVALLSEHGIEVVLLKGAALAHTEYDDLSQRPMFDLDLLVEPGRAREARKHLLANGWSWPSDRYPDEMYERHYHLPPLEIHRGPTTVVELHVDLFPEGHPFGFDGEVVRSRSRARSLANSEVGVPDPVDHVLYVCLHFAWIHGFGRGAWRTFRDVAVLSRDADFSWRELVRRARSARAGSCCYWSLLLAREMGGVLVPAPVLTELQPGSIGVPEVVLKRHFALELLGHGQGCPSLQLKRWMWSMAVRPRRSGHGDARPWSHSEDFASLNDEAPKTFGARLVWHLSSVGDWWRYLGRLLARRPSPRTDGPSMPDPRSAESSGDD